MELRTLAPAVALLWAAQLSGRNPAPRAAQATSATTFRFTPVRTVGEVPNPLRGQYIWLDRPLYPPGAPGVDSYMRYTWDQLEPTRGRFQWHLIDAQITAAKARGGRFGLRVMPLCMNCGGHRYEGAHSSIPDDLARVANPLVGSAPGLTRRYLLPDWNSEAYLARLEELVNAIGRRYGDEPTLAYVDVTGYGNWGEFHVWPFDQPGGAYDGSRQRPITGANARRIVRMNARAFRTKLLVLNSQIEAAVDEAVQTRTPVIGLRVDCLGADAMGGGQWPIERVRGAAELWRRAPFFSEWCERNIGDGGRHSGANLFVQGAAQVRKYHVSTLSSGNFEDPPSTPAELEAYTSALADSGYRLRVASMKVGMGSPGRVAVVVRWVNEGVAPTYLAWRAVLTLRGAVSHEAPLSVDVRKVMPDGPLDHSETLQVGTLPKGRYELLLRVEDIQRISPPMRLAMEGRDDEGNYLLGSVSVP